MNGGNCVTSLFDASPPSIEDYLCLDESSPPLDEGEDEIPLGYTYDFGGIPAPYKESEDISINIHPGSLYHQLNK